MLKCVVCFRICTRFSSRRVPFVIVLVNNAPFFNFFANCLHTALRLRLSKCIVYTNTMHLSSTYCTFTMSKSANIWSSLQKKSMASRWVLNNCTISSHSFASLRTCNVYIMRSLLCLSKCAVYTTAHYLSSAYAYSMSTL